MKCKICGHRTNTLQAMNKHYAKAHPGAKKKRKSKLKPAHFVDIPNPDYGKYVGERKTLRVTERARLIRICPHCGGEVED